ncbi:MAG: glycosyltransferase family 4 protein [Micrococcales bacterium]|nr:glycosyltransferase family 4 protein [Micrococcales bacterium]
MKVLRLSHSGVVDAWRERERELRRRGVDVRLLSARRWYEGGQDVPLRPRPGEDVVGVRTWGTHPALFVWDPIALWRELGADVDVLDIHEEPFALATWQVLVTRRLRRVLTRRPARLAPFVVYSAQNLDKRYPPPFRWIQRWVLRDAAGVSVCNTEAGEICRDRGLTGQVAVIPLGIDPTELTPDPDAAPATDRVVVGYAGRFEEAKGLRVLLDAVRDEPRLELVLAGGGTLADEVAAASEATDGRIRSVGALDVDALPGFYRGLTVLAVPSLTTPAWVEQFGRVVAEAMACGVPVVAARSGALPDVVADAGVLVDEGDPAALREALLAVGSDPALWSRLRTAGLARAERFTWGAVADAYLELYERVT